MIKTSYEICRKCQYSLIIGTASVCCDYLLKTGNMRDCEIGYCDKYEKRKKKTRLPDDIWLKMKGREK